MTIGSDSVLFDSLTSAIALSASALAMMYHVPGGVPAGIVTFAAPGLDVPGRSAPTGRNPISGSPRVENRVGRQIVTGRGGRCRARP